MSVAKQVQNVEITEANIESLVKDLYRECEKGHIPMFLAYYLEDYHYKAILPNELPNNGNVDKNNDKILEFLRITKGYNKENYYPTIQNNNKE